MRSDQGFVAENVLTFRVALPERTYPKAPEVMRVTSQLVDRLGELPSVEAAGATTDLPVSASPQGTAFEFDGHPTEAGRLPPIVDYSTITPGFFATLRVRILRGSDFDSSDLREGARTIIVNRAAADQYWPGADAVGKRIRAAGSSPADSRPWFTVRGVVADVRQRGLRDQPRPTIYFPINATGDNTPRAFTYVLRGPNVRAQADAVRQTVWAINPDLPLASILTMQQVVERSVTQFSFTMLTLGIAAAVALLLGAVGLYGVLSYAVSLRTREIGVRLALGAPPSRVRRGVMASAAAITAIGLVVGAAGAAGLTRLLGGLLFETTPLDAATFAGMSALLFAVALLAAYLPARKAASVSPMEAMRSE
jgi:predicted permease